MTDNTLMTDGQTTNNADAPQPAATEPTGGQVAQGEVQQTQAQEADTPTTTDDLQGADGEQGKAEDKPGAPEQYDFKAPDGKQFDTAVIDAYSEVAKELNLSNDDAQKLLDKVAPVIQSRQEEQIAAVRSEWGTQSANDKEFGGDKLQENLGVAKKALDAFGTPELKALLTESGLGNHPELIRAFYRAGKAISEDKFVGGKPSTQANDAKSLYPNSNMN